MQLTGKVVLVTGAQQGIGRAMSREFASAGADVVINLLDDDGAAQRVAHEVFVIGDRVRVKNEFVSGHGRMRGYIRGKTGVVVGISPPYPFPDASTYNLQSQDEPTYDESFRTEDLLPNAADQATVHVGVFESYLKRAP